MTTSLAVLLGALIGVGLGAIGGGGSILTVPALVYALGEPIRAATMGSLIIVGLSSLVGTIGHARSGHVRWRNGLVFGLCGVAFSFAGTAANRAMQPKMLLLLFALLIAIAAGMMLRRQRQRCGVDRPGTLGNSKSDRAECATSTRVPAARGAGHIDVRLATSIVGSGTVVGFMTGLFGVGGGFLIVPALVMTLRLPMRDAVGTSLMVIALNAAAAIAARAGTEPLQWGVVIPFTAAALTGSLAGSAVAGRLSERALVRAFAALMFAVAGYVAARNATALTVL